MNNEPAQTPMCEWAELRGNTTRCKNRADFSVSRISRGEVWKLCTKHARLITGFGVM